jgi:hypothetical protein
MSIRDWALCVAMASAVLWIAELKKLIVRRPSPSAPDVQLTSDEPGQT